MIDLKTKIMLWYVPLFSQDLEVWPLNFPEGSIVWPEIPKIHLHSHEMPKNITDGVLEPEIRINSKYFCLDFFSLHPTEQSEDKNFFIKTIFCQLFSFCITLEPAKSIFRPFLKQN